MAKFIVNASNDVRAPKYLLDNRHLITIGRLPPFSPLQNYAWPIPDQLKMDEMQFNAFKACLTREFAIVQGIRFHFLLYVDSKLYFLLGPPGTGKTFLGKLIHSLSLLTMINFENKII